MDRRFSNPEEYDNSIDWDDEPDGSSGGYTRHGNYILPTAMMEIVELRAQLAESESERQEQARLLGISGSVQMRRVRRCV